MKGRYEDVYRATTFDWGADFRATMNYTTCATTALAWTDAREPMNPLLQLLNLSETLALREVTQRANRASFERAPCEVSMKLPFDAADVFAACRGNCRSDIDDSFSIERSAWCATDTHTVTWSAVESRILPFVAEAVSDTTQATRACIEEMTEVSS